MCSSDLRMDGVLFVSLSQPVEKSQEVLNRYLNYVEDTVRRFLENKIEKAKKLGKKMKEE